MVFRLRQAMVCSRGLMFGCCMLIIGCHCFQNPLPHIDPEERVLFSLVDVGQGLSQIVMYHSQAVIIDMGDSSAVPSWLLHYKQIGSPSIVAVIITHTHKDHYGGLAALRSLTSFSGLILGTQFLDTARIRSYSKIPFIRFKTIQYHDTIRLLPEIQLVCMWPFNNLDSLNLLFPPHDSINRTSLCLSLLYKNTSLCLASDIDTIAQQQLCLLPQNSSRFDALVIPHHGSAASLNKLFYAVLYPRIAMLSCGAQNQFGHPSQELVKFVTLFLQIPLFQTAFQGSIRGNSDGVCWQWSTEN